MKVYYETFGGNCSVVEFPRGTTLSTAEKILTRKVGTDNPPRKLRRATPEDVSHFLAMGGHIYQMWEREADD